MSVSVAQQSCGSTQHTVVLTISHCHYYLVTWKECCVSVVDHSINFSLGMCIYGIAQYCGILRKCFITHTHTHTRRKSVYVCVGHDEYVMVRGQCMRVIFLLSCVNSKFICQTWQACSLPAEPSCQPKCCVLRFLLPPALSVED